MSGVAERLTWTLGLVAPANGDRILEIGCGRGVAARIAGQEGARLLGLDRSETAIAAAQAQCADFVASGQIAFLLGAIETANLGGRRFDKIFAVNVNAFWLDAPAPLAGVRGALADGGRLWLAYEPPSAAKAEEIEARLAPSLAASGFAATFERSKTASGAALIAAVAG